MVGQKPREIAARILLRQNRESAYLEEILDHELSTLRLPPVDRALVQELCYGTTRWRAALDGLIERKASRTQLAFPARTLLRLGLYQLLWLDRIPPHAAVHETVEASRALGFARQSGFINAVLRGYARTADSTRAMLADLRTRDPALGWSHPRWLVERWQSRFTPAELQALLAWNNTPASVFGRLNTLKTDAHQLIETWREEGVDYDFGRWDWIEENLLFRLRRHPPLHRMKSFREGWFYIQDPSTLLSVHVLAPRPRERILDLCAAPGGKTTLIAQRLNNDGAIVAAEADDDRRGRLLQNCDRLGTTVQVTRPDDPKAEGPFDAVLVDAPCSNSGVLGRRLDARWRLTLRDLDRCRRLQAQLLAEGLRRTRPGGRVVYSTCSLEPEENHDLVGSVLAQHPWGELVSERLLHPARDAVDGAFVALIRRKEPTESHA